MTLPPGARQSESCASWEYSSPHLQGLVGCRLNPDVPLTAHSSGHKGQPNAHTFCGVKGSGWAAGGGNSALTWTQRPKSTLPTNGSSVYRPGPDMGDVTLQPTGPGDAPAAPLFPAPAQRA